jgi:hypothetical protein
MEGPKASRQSSKCSAFALKKQRERAENRAFFVIFVAASPALEVSDLEDFLRRDAGF